MAPLECPFCGLNYDDMRTGYTYRDIFEMFWSGNEDPSTWRNKRRHTILGRWREIKLAQWSEHLEMCELQNEYEAQVKAGNHVEEFEELEGVPF